MELVRWPKNEDEYWLAIESLEMFVRETNRVLIRRRIKNPAKETRRDITESCQISKDLKKEVCEKFGVVLERSEAVSGSGKTYYQDWYHKMKKICIQREYEKVICSACPFSEGVAEMIRTTGFIPCSKWKGALHELAAPYLCAMTSHDWTEEELKKKIVEKGGIIALEQFERKERALRAEANNT